MPFDAQTLYDEFHNDPLDLGYKIGNGLTFQEKEEAINVIRPEISVIRVPSERIPLAGEVIEPLKIQLLRDCIAHHEYEDNCHPDSDDNNLSWHEKQALRSWIHLLLGGLSPDSYFEFTTAFKEQIIRTFPNNLWPDTRNAIIALQTRPGSRAEKLFGSPPAPIGRQQMLLAEEYAVANELPTLYE